MAHRNAHADMFGLARNPRRYAGLTGWFFSRVHARVVDDVAEAPLPDGARVLDIGTGPGGVPRAIAARRPTLDVRGIDLSAEMIAYAKAAPSTGNVSFTVADVAALPYPDASFDLVISSMSQHHWSDIGGGLREIIRVLKPAGEAWIYDARFALRTARAKTRSLFGDHATDFTAVRTGRTPIPLIARLRISAQLTTTIPPRAM